MHMSPNRDDPSFNFTDGDHPSQAIVAISRLGSGDNEVFPIKDQPGLENALIACRHKASGIIEIRLFPQDDTSQPVPATVAENPLPAVRSWYQATSRNRRRPKSTYRLPLSWIVGPPLLTREDGTQRYCAEDATDEPVVAGKRIDNSWSYRSY